MDDGADDEWDAVVIGTGMGGSTIGYALAAQGFRVLFLEKGLEKVSNGSVETEDPVLRLQRAAWPERAIGEIDGRKSEFYVSLGSGPGGSTLSFGAAMERFERSDFDELEGLPHPTGGWPVSYDQFAPWYERAEALYKVKGTRDPLSEPIPASMTRPPPARRQDQLFMQDFAAAGLHPYRLHVGIAYKPGCEECIGTICEKSCKSDAGTICLKPAVREHRATLRTECEVQRLHAEGGRVTGVDYLHRGQQRTARGRVVILAAGTYRSAALMLGSTSADWPKGIGNQNDLVGRNLMFHSSDWIAIWPKRRGSTWGPSKSLSFRDLYLHDGQRLGTVQSTGLTAEYGNVLMFLRQWFDRSALRHFVFLRPFLRIPAKIATKLFGSATLFAMIIEDIGDPENRLLHDPAKPGRIVLRYKISKDLQERTRLARRLLKQKLAGFRMYWLRHDLLLDFGHPTGTCRFGDDPQTSVLDRDCRVHGLDNLHVVDGSFMPSSGGANPSLTIAANALRVAEAVAGRLRGGAV